MPNDGRWMDALGVGFVGVGRSVCERTEKATPSRSLSQP